MTHECPQLALVEALYDGRLGAQERASVERHVSVCGACGALGRDLERIRQAVRAPREPASPLAHQRARQALLRHASRLPEAASELDTAEPGPLPRAPRRATFVALAAATLLLAAFSGWLGARVSAPEQALVALHARPSRVALGDEVRPSEGARFERSKTAELDAVTLSNGTLDVSVGALRAGTRFVVRTRDAEVEGGGAMFRIEAEDGRIRGVLVSEGSVDVRYAGFAAVITSGGSWRASSDSAPAPAAPHASVAPTPAAAPVAVAAKAPVHERVAARSAPPASRDKPRGHEATPISDDSLAHSSANAVAPPPPPTDPAASREFAEAMQALGRGDLDRGAARLEAFASAHPHDARADEADYVRAIALQRAGHTAEASSAAQRYLATRPEGAHRAEARLIAGR